MLRVAATMKSMLWILCVGHAHCFPGAYVYETRMIRQTFDEVEASIEDLKEKADTVLSYDPPVRTFIAKTLHHRFKRVWEKLSLHYMRIHEHLAPIINPSTADASPEVEGVCGCCNFATGWHEGNVGVATGSIVHLDDVESAQCTMIQNLDNPVSQYINHHTCGTDTYECYASADRASCFACPAENKSLPHSIGHSIGPGQRPHTNGNSSRES